MYFSNVKLYIRLMAALLCLLILLCVPGAASAKDIVVEPKLNQGFKYNDNLFLDDSHEVDDFISDTLFELKLGHSNDTSNTKIKALWEGYKYMDNDDLDTIDQYYELDLNYRFVPKVRFELLSYYLNDTYQAQSYQLEEEGGILLIQEEREKYNISPGINFELTELVALKLEYNFSNNRYTGSKLEDYKLNKELAELKIRLKDEKTSLITRVDHGYYDFKSGFFRNYNFMTGLKYQLLENASFEFFGGFRYTDIDFTSKKENEVGFIADAALDVDLENVSFNIWGSRKLIGSAIGKPLLRNAVGIKITHNFSETFSAFLEGKFYEDEKTGSLSKTKYNIFIIKPAIRYYINKSVFCDLRYRFVGMEDDVDNSNAYSNEVTASVTFDLANLF